MSNICWAIFVNADGFLSLSPDDLRYFHDHFCGKSMKYLWKNPPPYTVLSRSRPINDFVSWEVGAPVVSERASNIIRPIAHPHVEFLSFGLLKGRPYFAVNVLSTMDYVDFDASDIDWLPGVADGLPKSITLRRDIGPLPPMFKLKRIAGQVYVSDEMARVLVDAGLTGFALARPTTHIFERILKRESLDDYSRN